MAVEEPTVMMVTPVQACKQASMMQLIKVGS
jgi:hypothetical protein